MVSVLLIDDDTELSKLLEEYLQSEQFELHAAHDGPGGLEKALANHYSAVVLDVMLPGMSGLDVLKQLRQKSSVPVLMLTARGSELDRILGLELGADDYLPKPFAFAELVARVRALSRRAPSVPPVLRRGDLAVDRARHRASRGDRPLSLTRKEFGILETLLAADGAVVSAEELLEHVWDAHADPFSNIVSVTMTRLRRKLGDPPLIETVVGKGYRM